MAGKFRYVPLLRTKTGESAALGHLTPAAKARIFPVFHVVNKPPAKFADEIIAAWSGRPLALDGTYSMNLTGSPTDFTQMFDKLGKGKVGIIPSVESGSNANQVATIAKLKDKYAPGLVLKVRQSDVANAQAWAAQQNWKPSDIDLIVDLGEIAAIDPALLEAVAVQSLQASILGALPWRTVTLAGSSAPKDHGGLPAGRSLKPRIESKVWLGAYPKLKFQLDYGDYASGHPDLTDPPDFAITRATVSARYAVDNSWIIMKGTPTKGKTGQPMEKQYRAHAKALAAEKKFGGVSGCWADGQIKKIAGSSTVRSGNRTTWVTIAVNRHVSLVADSLP